MSSGDCSTIPSPARLRDPTELAQARAFLDWVTALVRRHRRDLIGLARAEGLTPEDAFDAVQEAFHTFVTIPQSRVTIGEDEDARRLLVVIARNAARNRRRLHANARPHTRDSEQLAALPDGAPPLDEIIASAEAHLRLEGCMRTLAELPRAVVTLRMLEERPGDEVASALGLKPGHVAVVLQRAKARLQDCLVAQGVDGV